MILVKCTHIAQKAIVTTVKGIAIAANSQALSESLIWPLSFVCTNWVEKKF